MPRAKTPLFKIKTKSKEMPDGSVDADAYMPAYSEGEDYSVALDLKVCFEDRREIKEGKILVPDVVYTIGTGVFLEIPEGYYCQVVPRSGLAAKYGLTITNSPGIIDTEYRGEIKVICHRVQKRIEGVLGYSTNIPTLHLKDGDRFAQLVIQKVNRVQFKRVDELSASRRGEKGLGSSGK